MKDDDASRTAVTAALMRALHTRLDHPRLIDDAWGDRLVSAAEKAALCERVFASADPDAHQRLESLGFQQAIVDAVLRRHPTYGGVIIRSRCAEDALERAVASGVRQYVLLGAGLDSFSVRQPSFARAIQIFEIDHPATQAMKQRRLQECGANVPTNVHFVAADLSRESLAAALTRAGFSRVQPAFFSWLGVTIYLTREANLATLRAIAASSAPGSEIVFNYIDQRVMDGRSERLEKIRASVAATGEPWLSGFDPPALAADLEAIGLVLLEDLGHAELRRRYCADRAEDLSPSLVGHIARAAVAGDHG